MKTLLKNAKILLKGQTKTKNIVFEDKIEEILPNNITPKNCKIIDAKKLLVLPGVIDAHVHFMQPGFEEQEDFFSGSSAAIAGGVTCVADMPCTSIPPVTTVEALNNKIESISKNSLVDFALWGGINSLNVDVKQLWKAGVCGFKIYTVSSMDSFKALSYKQIQKVLENYKNTDILFAFHAEDANVIKQNIEKYKSKLHLSSTFSKIRSIKAESTAVANILKASQGNRLHFVHISSKQAAKKILKAGQSFETCPHYLEFTNKDFKTKWAKLKTAPSVKNLADKEFLQNQLCMGNINYIATDHAANNFTKTKTNPNFFKNYNGIPGIQHYVCYIVSKFYLNNKMPLSVLYNVLSTNPAKTLGIYPKKGSFEVGTDADFTLINCQKPMKITEKQMLCKHKYTPFAGLKLNCCIAKTIIRGKTVFDDGKVLANKGFGKWVKRY